jgi:hypothetical protein
MMATIRIAIVQDRDGHLTTAGPNDAVDGYKDAMDAAMSWHLEAGHLPAAIYWAEVDLPPVPSIPELRTKTAAGEFPKTLLAEWDSEHPVITQHAYDTPRT